MAASALILRGDARALPLPDASVDAIVTDPPYNLSDSKKRARGVPWPAHHRGWSVTGWTWRHEWPIQNTDRRLSVVADEVARDLDAQVAAAGVRLLAAPQWSIATAEDGSLSVTCQAPAEVVGVLSPMQRRPIVALLAQPPYSWPDGRIAAAVHASPGAVWRDRAALGIPSAVGRGRPRSAPSRRLQIARRRPLVAKLVCCGHSDTEIAEVLSVSRATVYYDRCALGLSSVFAPGGRPRQLVPAISLPTRKAA